MADQGWYPDPGGRSGHFRYWDGSRWSDETSTNPQAPAPGMAASSSTSTPRSRPTATVWLALVGVLVVAVVIFLVVRSLLSGGELVDPPPPQSTVSAWDETSSPDPSPSDETPPGQMSCPHGDPYAQSDHPADGRVHGGGLSFAEVGNGYGSPATEMMLSWMNDTQSQDQVTEPGWISVFAVGAVESQPYFDSLEGVATSSMECGITNGWYSGFTGRTDLRNEPMTVDGHDAYIVEAEVRVDKEGLSVEGDVLTFVAVQTGKDTYGVFMAMAPIGDEPRLAIADGVLESLRVD